MNKLFVVSLFSLVFINAANAQCSVNIRTDLPAKDPVYIKKNGGSYELWVPPKGFLNFTSDEIYAIACTGSGNNIVYNSAVNSPITCSSGTTITLGSANLNTTTVDCKNTITGDILNTGLVCGGTDGKMLTIGFKTTSYGFITFIQACFNMNTASIIYTRHVINGNAINYAVIEADRPGFKTSGMPSTVAPAISYTQATQLTRLTYLLGSSTQAKKFVNSSSYLSRGHLAPDADGIFRSWQFATYFYANVAPEWQIVNAGNWLRVEEAARAVAGYLQDDVLIFTGVHEILTLPHVNGTQVPITLEAAGIPVPKWLWKIIKSTASNSGIALITLNNPFVTSLPAAEMLCTNVCSTAGWDSSSYSDFKKGFTYCCSVASLMAAVPGIPAEANVANILNL